MISSYGISDIIIFTFILLSYFSGLPVEKAALVFSLKLDSGHKLLCPWVDNTCDESLLQFPAKTTALLVEDYKNRFSTLFQLSALPLIPPSSIDYMRSPQLVEFLEGSSSLENNGCADTSGSLIKKHPSSSSSSYYQVRNVAKPYE